MKQTLFSLTLLSFFKRLYAQNSFQIQLGVSSPIGASAKEIKTYGLGGGNYSSSPPHYLNNIVHNQKTYGFSKGINIGIR